MFCCKSLLLDLVGVLEPSYDLFPISIVSLILSLSIKYIMEREVYRTACLCALATELTCMLWHHLATNSRTDINGRFAIVV